MVKATLYIETKSNLPLQISEKSETDLGLISHLRCTLAPAAIANKWKQLTIVTRSLVLDIAEILHMPLKVTIATHILVQKPINKCNFFIKTNFDSNYTLCKLLKKFI